MSFGRSVAVRFDHDGGGVKKPLVFWEQQAIVSSQKSNKKFSYMRREQKFNLRDRVEPEAFLDEMPPPPATRARNGPPGRKQDGKNLTSQPAKRDLRQNKKDNVKKNPKHMTPEPRIGPSKPDQRSGKPSSRPNKPSLGAPKSKKPTPETAGTVVLTQKQFDEILETIGTLTIEAEDAKQAQDNLQAKFASHHDNLPVSSRKPDIKTDPTPSSKQTPSVDPVPDSVSPSKSDPMVVEPQAIPGLNARQEKPGGELRRSVIGIPTAHLTKAEKKRLEWERERAESAKAEEWSPWGRPGAGAPMKDKNGNVISDYNKRQPQGTENVPNPPPVKKSQQVTISTRSPSHELNDPVKVEVRDTSERHVKEQPLSSTTPVSVAHRDVAVTPAAVRSSFTMGDPAPDENQFQSVKDQERRRWLEDLEKQRREQRERKQSERERWLQEELHDTWADRFVAPPPTKVTSQVAVHPQTVSSGPHAMGTPATELERPETDLSRTASAPATNIATATAPPETSPRSYLRGQNVAIDSATRRELEEKRKKHEDHQAFIRKQIEEKERVKREEKEQRRREEQAEEERMQRERQQIEDQLQQERDQQKAKEDEERLRLDTLKQAMEQAQEIAEREKHEKRMRKLQRAGHDVSHLNATFEAKMTPRVTDASVHVEPTFVPGLFPSPRDIDNRHESPTRERVLTPTKHRYTPILDQKLSPQRDLPGQTAQIPGISRESTGIEYTGPLYERKKKVRVKSAPRDTEVTNLRAKSASSENLPQKPPKKRQLRINERPKWGYSNPDNKRAVKQSERDPFFERKQREREVRRAQRQDKMQQMAVKHSPKVSEVTTVASRARSRSNERAPSTESEVRARSRSPPASRLGHGGVVGGHQSRTDSRGSWGRDVPADYGSPHEAFNQHHHRQQPRSTSPPIPAIKHRKPGDYNAENYADGHQRGGKYHDPELVNPPLNNSQFVPFIRSTDVLDPAHADSPVPISREPSIVDKARKAYVQEHDPAKFGFVMDNYNDDLKKNVEPQPSQKPHRPPGDPILNPALVIEHPSGRQNQILQRLSDLRRGLMQKRKELEFALPAMDQALTDE